MSAANPEYHNLCDDCAQQLKDAGIKIRRHGKPDKNTCDHCTGLFHSYQLGTYVGHIDRA